jgi:patatin-like phospholipase/acyl hydrolase
MRCLCIDGGGIKSIASISFLMQLVDDRLIYDPNFNLYDAFDVFSGTSAGSFIVLALGIMQMDVSKIMSLFCSGLAESVFSSKSFFSGHLLTPKYSSTQLKTMLHTYFGSTRMISKDKLVLVPSYNLTKCDLTIFNSKDKDHHEYTCVDVALASSAAPCLLPTVKSNDQWFIDGGIIVNNPSLLTLGVCKKLQYDDIKIMSIGSGRFVPKVNGESSCDWGALQWAHNGIFKIIYDGEHVAHTCSDIMDKDFIRINSNVPETMSETDNNKVLNIVQLIKLGKTWYWENKKEIWEWFDWEFPNTL